MHHEKLNGNYATTFTIWDTLFNTKIDDEKNKPLILVVNDDGIESVGIRVLISVMRSIGDVYVVAPDSNRSGASHSMTLHKEIVIKNIDKQQYEFTCSGTPVDCVKVAFNKILPRKPDLCVSGINHGSNHSINSLYSGTLHAAMEATIQGVSSIAFSHLSYDQKTDLTEFNSFIKRISELLIANKLPREITLNTNFPDVPYNDIKGVRLCNQGKARGQKFSLQHILVIFRLIICYLVILMMIILILKQIHGHYLINLYLLCQFI